MIAAAGAGVPAVEHEFFGAQPRLPRLFVERRRVAHQLVPAVGRMDVDLDHAGVGRDLEMVQPMIVRRRVAFDHDRQCASSARGLLDRGDQVEVVLEPTRTGGMKTCSRPWRGSTHRAVRITVGTDWLRAQREAVACCGSSATAVAEPGPLLPA